MDAAKRAEYESTVADVDNWDTSSWTVWTITGRVLPERCNVRIPETNSRGVFASGRVKVQFVVANSQIQARCTIESPSASIFEIADVVRSVVTFPVDFIGVQNRGAYEVVLDVCRDTKTGNSWDIPIFEPFFQSQQEGLCFDPDAVKSGLQLPLKAGSVPATATALHDLTNAVRYPRRTFENCRMAIEVMRSHFDPKDVKSWRERYAAGEVAMCKALKISGNTLKDLEAVAARSRHGDLVYSINYESRRQALELGWEAMARFIAFLEGRASSKWRLLDQRFSL